MNNGEKISENTTFIQIAERYIGNGKAKGDNMWYISPFRTEKTPSFCVNNNKGLHDFGSGEHYNSITFVAKLFNRSNEDAMKIIANDFNIILNDYTYLKAEYYKNKLKNKDKKFISSEDIEYFFDVIYQNFYKLYYEVQEDIKECNMYSSYLKTLCDIQNKCEFIIELFDIETKKNIFINKKYFISLLLNLKMQLNG